MPESEEPLESATPPPPPPPPADEVLLGAVALAQRALLEVTAPETVGSVIGHVVDGEHVLSLHFASDLAGYPGWHWSVTLARVEGEEPTVLETELLPGGQALLAPEWVPWSERLAEYRAAQAAAAAEAAESGEEPESDDAELEAGDGFGEEAEVDDDAEDAAEEFGDDDSDGDDVFDGIDIDALDDVSEDEDDEDEDGSDEDDSDGDDSDEDDSDGDDSDDDDSDDDDV
ncbi:hypothetical protein BCL57_002934 [Agromyces flavus]|uniref:DUF3027 domain-containing protein n=1 Tax=Agromyces flavus TaxID=589382 RepID=A0A1H1MD81_9MICO|nr:DUF3027 domain-containing protein [Agromyces flavus]MCP2368758.1 hypothetical protein [Agromyces flavus]GGI48004.1 hypothetical protein GCM10010932_26920 [Agromyces flavus]SDR84610.1 Protein of unknown function [Agromyces flavus]